MTPRPRIAVAGIVRDWGGAARTGVNAAYVTSVVDAGAVPFILPPLIAPENVEDALDGFDALLLTGGEDVDPAFYGEAPSPRLGATDPVRDRFELALFRSARARGLPVLGICRGLQLINVALGGTLWQDLASERAGATDHHPEASRGARTHRVRLLAGSRAARALAAPALAVNSFHHQAIRRLGSGVIESGWAEDGLIEAFEAPAGEPWLLAVQWHPEELANEPDSPDRHLFAALVAEARASSLAMRR